MSEEGSMPAECSNSSKFLTPAVRAYLPRNIVAHILGYPRRAMYLCEPIRPSVRHKK
jgi:hypothetical protein